MNEERVQCRVREGGNASKKGNAQNHISSSRRVENDQSRRNGDGNEDGQDDSRDHKGEDS